MGFLWDFYGISMGSIWDFYGIYMGFLCDLRGIYLMLRFDLTVWVKKMTSRRDRSLESRLGFGGNHPQPWPNFSG